MYSICVPLHEKGYVLHFLFRFWCVCSLFIIYFLQLALSKINVKFRTSQESWTHGYHIVKNCKYTTPPLAFCCHLVWVDLTHIFQGYFAGTGAILWLPQCQRSNPEGYGPVYDMDILRIDGSNTTKERITKTSAYMMTYTLGPFMKIGHNGTGFGSHLGKSHYIWL